MKTKYKQYISRILVAVLIGAILGVGAHAFISYSKMIDMQLFEASSDSLEETYCEVVTIFDEITRSRWNYLKQIGEFIEHTNTDDEGNTDNIDDTGNTDNTDNINNADNTDNTDNTGNIDNVDDYINNLKQIYGFTEFYLIDESGQYMTVDGSTGYIDFGDALFDLVDNGTDIVTDGSLPNRENMFFYAVATDESTYHDFAYCGVAFGYNMMDLSDVLKVEIYGGASDVYLAYPNGRVCVSMGDVKYEYRNILSAIEDLNISDEIYTSVEDDLKSGETNTLKIAIEGKEYYLSYQSTKLSDWRFVSLTPVSVVDKSIYQVRSSTTGMMAALFSVIVLLVVIAFIYWIWHVNRDKKSLLAERELIFGVMSEHMNEIYFLYHEPSGKMLYISPNVERMLGLTPKEVYENEKILNKQVKMTGAWDKESYLGTIKPGEALHKEYYMVNSATGEVRPYLLDLYRPVGEYKETLVGALTDNFEENKVRQNIIDALETARAANSAKSSFLSNMSHDIRTPMNAILGFTTLLERDADKPSLVRQHTAKIKRSGTHLLGLINDVLDMSKIESGKTVLNFSPLCIDEITDEMTDLMGSMVEAKNQKITTRRDYPKGEKIYADKLRLMQILQNLLSNAVKYTDDGGEIEFGIIRLPQEQDESFAGYLFVVKDNGIGMSEDFLEHIFEPFSREVRSTVNKVQGTGLGMAITKNLVELMGGTISVTSEPNVGTSFEVMIKFHVEDEGSSNAAKDDVETVDNDNRAAQADSKAADSNNRSVQADSTAADNDEVTADGSDSSSEKFSLRGMHILAAEDNELNTEILVELLDMEGAACEIVENGKEAVERFENEEETGLHYDLILMDVQMPVMNGYDATKEIRTSSKNKRGATIPIIAMTANAFSEDIQNAFSAGMNAHMSKPIDMSRLADVVKRVYEKMGER